jgi:hypothetical protein
MPLYFKIIKNYLFIISNIFIFLFTFIIAFIIIIIIISFIIISSYFKLNGFYSLYYMSIYLSLIIIKSSFIYLNIKYIKKKE